MQRLIMTTSGCVRPRSQIPAHASRTRSGRGSARPPTMHPAHGCHRHKADLRRGFLCDGVNSPFTVQALTFSRGKAGSGGARRAELEARVNQLVLMATPSGRWVLPASDEFLGAL